MAERYHRSQLLLEPEQHDRIRPVAEREGRSISDVARQAIDIGLDALDLDEQAQVKRRTLAIKRLGEMRATVRKRYGIYEGDLIAEVRASREESLEQARGESP
jgi:hypothetical protein